MTHDKVTFAERMFEFYSSLRLDIALPQGVSVMNPYQNSKIQGYVKTFLDKFYGDNRARILVFGINPGRFGSGITGITFTDPVALEMYCGISNNLQKKRELSSIFIYEFAKEWGGPQKLYRDFFFTAVSPLGFVKNEKNFNFYDNASLLADIKPFLVRSIELQIASGATRNAAIVLGTGKIKQIFEKLNHGQIFFRTIYFLEHPRFIMQYRRSRLQEYIKKYHEVFTQALAKI